MEQFSKYVGQDVHKDTIVVSTADAGRSKAHHYGTIKHTAAAVSALLKKITPDGEVLELCYKADPYGYGLYHQLTASAHECQVVAPTLIPKRASDKMKTDRRDSLRLAELLRAGELTPVWVPDAEQEAIRDPVRTRDDFKTSQRQVRQQLLAFLLRHSQRYWTGGKKNWTQGFWKWLEALRKPSAHQQFALKEYVDAVRRLLIESAWCYCFSARKSREIEQRAQKTSPEVLAIAWKAQKRLNARYRALSERGLSSCKVVTAVARELSGFIWAVVKQVRCEQLATA